MRAAALTGIVLAAFAAGCGGGADRGGNRAGPGAQPSATAVAPAASHGRLGGALVARPGGTVRRARPQPITGDLTKPRPVPRGGVAAEDSCSDVDVMPTQQNLAHVSDVIFCLMNAMRADAGLPALQQQDELARASVAHSQDMVDQKYFAHDSLDGRDLVARLKEVGYIPAAGEWVVGENLAWGSGTLATPKALVNAWMNSPGHRANLLASDYREVGMGVVYGTPSASADDGVTVTTDFGMRPPAAPATPRTATTASRAKARRAARAKARRARALRRCKRSHGRARTRCVRVARRIR